MNELLLTAIQYAFLPFVFYPLWGPFAAYGFAALLADHVVRRAAREDDTQGRPALKAFIGLLLLFSPAVVGSKGGMALIFPWWLGYLGMALNPLYPPATRTASVDALFGAMVCIPLAMGIAWHAARRARRRAVGPGKN